MNCWEILGISPTDNLKEIKRAYAAKSREVHPEEHPEEFKALHEAYEMALALAKRQAIPTVEPAREVEPQGEVEVEEEDDLVERVETATVEEQGYTETDWRAPQNVDEEGYIDFDGIFQKSDIDHNREVVRCSNLVFERFAELLSTGEKSELAWSSIFYTEEFIFAADSPYFLSRITDFVRENQALPKCFYFELNSLYSLSAIATRERQGIFEELISIIAQRNMLATQNQKEPFSKVSTWGYSILVILYAITGFATRNLEDVPIWVYLSFLAFVVIFIVAKLIERLKRKKTRRTEEEERIEEIEKKQRKKSFLSVFPVHHVMEVRYYSRLTLMAWMTLFSLAFLQVMLEYEDDLSAALAFCAFALSLVVLAVCFLTNLISFLRHKISKIPVCFLPLTDEERKTKNRLFRVLLGISIGLIVLAFIWV